MVFYLQIVSVAFCKKAIYCKDSVAFCKKIIYCKDSVTFCKKIVLYLQRQRYICKNSIISADTVLFLITVTLLIFTRHRKGSLHQITKKTSKKG